MSEWITVTIKEIQCIKRSEFKGRADEIYLKQRGSDLNLWPSPSHEAKTKRITKGETVYPNCNCFYKPEDKNGTTIELWEHDKLAKDDFLGSVTLDAESQGEHTQYMDGDGGSYRFVYSVDNPYKKQASAAQATKSKPGDESGDQSNDSSGKTKTIKRLVVCCDGTWQNLVKDYPTNVVKTVQSVKPLDSEGINQVVYYHEGVGAESNISKEEELPILRVGHLEGLIDSVGGGGFGEGIDRNIKDAYRFLCINYSPGDEIYLFGFSRGAYTVRSLAGMLNCCGLLRREHLRHIPHAYELYRDQTKWDSEDMEQLRPLCHSSEEYGDRVPITLLACYDTVGSLGVPNVTFDLTEKQIPLVSHIPGIIDKTVPIDKLLNRKRYAFHDTKLGLIIQHALHAMAVDENRDTFSITPMQKNDKAKHQTLRQVWFPGGHGCVGGGTEHESKLANNALRWMIAAIQELGLKLEFDVDSLPDGEQLFGQDESGQAYTDAAFNYKDNSDKSRLSRVTSGVRGALTKIPGITRREIPAEDKLHRSVSERWRKRPDYRPKNVMESQHEIIDQAILESNDNILLTS